MKKLYALLVCMFLFAVTCVAVQCVNSRWEKLDGDAVCGGITCYVEDMFVIPCMRSNATPFPSGDCTNLNASGNTHGNCSWDQTNHKYKCAVSSFSGIANADSYKYRILTDETGKAGYDKLTRYCSKTVPCDYNGTCNIVSKDGQQYEYCNNGKGNVTFQNSHDHYTTDGYSNCKE
jgi:hypothetical protein